MEKSEYLKQKDRKIIVTAILTAQISSFHFSSRMLIPQDIREQVCTQAIEIADELLKQLEK